MTADGQEDRVGHRCHVRGRSSARALVAEGWRVVGTGRRADRLKHLGHELGAENFLGLTFDLADSTARSDAIVSLIESFANIDLRVNHAGLALGTESAHRVAWSDWATMIETNIVGLSASNSSPLQNANQLITVRQAN